MRPALVLVLLYYIIKAIMFAVSEFITSVANGKPKSFPKYPEEPYYCVFNVRCRDLYFYCVDVQSRLEKQCGSAGLSRANGNSARLLIKTRST